MDTHRSITFSRRIYARLLALYPASHRTEYGADMLQLFTDQCRAAGQSGKPLAFVGLWLRTLVDLFVSAAREHATAPHAFPGLLEAIPNKPLPWGGVALVLLPGLTFFIAQVAQLTGLDWFFLLSYRAGYFMIIPVLIVWAWKRKFPIWGLMPLGLLFHTLMNLGNRMPYYLAYPAQANLLISRLMKLLPVVSSNTFKMAVTAVMLVSILVLLWLASRRVVISAAAWVALGANLLLMAFLAYRNVNLYFSWVHAVPKEDMQSMIALGLTNIGWDTFDAVYYVLYEPLGLLLLILLGVMLARRHGRLAVLLPLGYLLPTLVYGRVSNDWPGVGDPEFAFMLAVSATALAYRFLVALAGPLWIVRSASGRLQKRASAISLLALVSIQAGFNLVMLLVRWSGGGLIDSASNLIAQQMVLAAAVFLALTLYRAVPPVDLLPVQQSEQTAGV